MVICFSVLFSLFFCNINLVFLIFCCALCKAIFDDSIYCLLHSLISTFLCEKALQKRSKRPQAKEMFQEERRPLGERQQHDRGPEEARPEDPQDGSPQPTGRGSRSTMCTLV